MSNDKTNNDPIMRPSTTIDANVNENENKNDENKVDFWNIGAMMFQGVMYETPFGALFIILFFYFFYFFLFIYFC